MYVLRNINGSAHRSRHFFSLEVMAAMALRELLPRVAETPRLITPFQAVLSTVQEAARSVSGDWGGQTVVFAGSGFGVLRH